MDSLPGTLQEEVDQMDTVEAYMMMNGMCEDERVKLIRGEYQDTRYLLLEEERGMKYTEPIYNHCMNNRGKLSFGIVHSNTVNSDKACVSTELAYLIYIKVKNN